MPLYDYFCEKCDEGFEIVKSITQHQRTEPCPKCGNEASQDLSRCRPEYIGASVRDAYKCPALGKVIKSDNDRNEQAKRLGVVEVGNDFGSGDKLQTHYDKVREEKRNKVWEDL
jgi:putative FmdB family regulatory protein